MIVGVPKEIKRDEYRVGLLPVGAEELTRAGHRCWSKPGPAWAPAWPTRTTPGTGPNWSPPAEESTPRPT